MSDDLGWVDLGVRPDAPGFGTELSRQIDPDLDRVGRQAGSRFSAGFKKAAVAGAAGLATAGAFAIKLGIDSVNAASDLEESTNKVAEVFGKAADRVFRFSAKASDALGQTNEEARSAAATFGIFGKAADLNDRQAAKFSKRMVTLASDLASFNNTEPDQAVEALGAALRGEAEPIRAYGVLLDEATLKAEALALGLLKPVKNKSQIQAYQVAVIEGQKKYNDAVKEHGKQSLEALKAEAGLGTARDRLKKATDGTIPPLTQQQKLLAAQSEIFKQTSVAQGDFARTSDGLANQQRRMAARFEDTKAKLGEGLLPIMNDAAGFLLDEGIPAFERFSDWFNKDGIPALKTFGGHVKTTADRVGDLIGFLNDLPDPAKYAGLVALVGGVGAAKLRGGGGALGAVGKIAGVAKPVPVFVTNPGFSAGGGVDAGDVAGGKWSKYGKVFGAAAGVAILAASVKNVDSMLDDAVARHPDAKPKDFSDGVMNDGYIDFGSDWEKAKDDVIQMTGKVNGLNDALFLAGNKKIRPVMDDREVVLANRRLGQFISKMVDAGKPVTPYIDTSSIERALGLMAQLTDGMHGVPTAGTDGGVPFLSGAGQRAGIVNNFNGPMNVADGRDLTREAEKKARERSRGGRG